MTQPSLDFTLSAPEPRTRRRHVERTSVLAAQELGKVLESRQRKALEAARRWPGRTSGELATGDGKWTADNDAVLEMRIGLSMLRKRGFVEHVPKGARKCQRSGKQCVTWRVVQR